jgi:hypothetical protein
VEVTRKDAISFVSIVVVTVLLFSVFIFARLGLTYANSTNAVNAVVTIPLSCFTTVSPNAIDFGSVSPGTTSAVQTTTVSDVNGNVDSFPWISGGSWSVGGGTPTFYVTNTFYANSIFSSVFTALTTTPTNTFAMVQPTGTAISNVISLEVTVPSGQQADAYNQIIIITDTC